MVKRRTSPKKATHSKPSSYDNMMGHPMAISNHPSSNIPSPDGGLFSGQGLPVTGVPDPTAYGA